MNDIRPFLDRVLTATVSTVGPRQAPHSVPVWYRFDSERFVVWTDASRRWVKNIGRNPQVSVVVAESAPPFAAVVVRGTANVTVDGPDTDEQIRLIAERYLPADEVSGYVAQWRTLRAIVVITPSEIRAWSRGY